MVRHPLATQRSTSSLWEFWVQPSRCHLGSLLMVVISDVVSTFVFPIVLVFHVITADLRVRRTSHLSTRLLLRPSTHGRDDVDADVDAGGDDDDVVWHLHLHSPLHSYLHQHLSPGPTNSPSSQTCNTPHVSSNYPTAGTVVYTLIHETYIAYADASACASPCGV